MKLVCGVVRAGTASPTPQATAYAQGISAESVGAGGLCMHLGTLAPGAHAAAHRHEHPHRPDNLSDVEAAVFVVARTDARADEPTTLLE